MALSPIALELGSLPWSLSWSLFRAQLWDLPKDAAAHGSALDRHLLLNLWIALGLLVFAHLILFAGPVA